MKKHNLTILVHHQCNNRKYSIVNLVLLSKYITLQPCKSIIDAANGLFRLPYVTNRETSLRQRRKA